MPADLQNLENVYRKLSLGLSELTELPKKIGRVVDGLDAAVKPDGLVSDASGNLQSLHQAIQKIESFDSAIVYSQFQKALSSLKEHERYQSVAARVKTLMEEEGIATKAKEDQNFLFEFPDLVSLSELTAVDTASKGGIKKWMQKKNLFRDVCLADRRLWLVSQDPSLKLQADLNLKDKHLGDFLTALTALESDTQKEFIGHQLGIIAYKIDHALKEHQEWNKQDHYSDSFYIEHKRDIDDEVMDLTQGGSFDAPDTDNPKHKREGIHRFVFGETKIRELRIRTLIREYLIYGDLNDLIQKSDELSLAKLELLFYQFNSNRLDNYNTAVNRCDYVDLRVPLKLDVFQAKVQKDKLVK